MIRPIDSISVKWFFLKKEGITIVDSAVGYNSF